MGLLGVAWSNIVVGVAAALLVGAGTWAKDKIHDKYIERKFPIAGEYITKFEDEIEGEETVMTAPARLEQQGERVTGWTRMPGDDREWALKGEVSTDGYLNGVYYAVDPHDQGVGNFFLYINHDRTMEGLWSGYDEINRKITSGKYTFTPVFDAFNVEPLQKEWIPAVIDIADQRLGKDYLESEILAESLEADSSYFTRVATVDSTFRNDESLADRLADGIFDSRTPTPQSDNQQSSELETAVLGFCLGAVFSTSDLLTYLNVDGDEIPEGLAHADQVGVVRTVAVREGYEDRGLGTELVEECVEECFDRGATAICAVGWREEGDVNIRGIMSHFEFERAREYDEYWREESQRLDYRCKSCGDPPCTCSAILFTRYR